MAGVVALRGLRRLIGLYNITRLVLRRIMAGVCEFRRGALTLAVSSGPGLVIRKPGGLRMTGPIHKRLGVAFASTPRGEGGAGSLKFKTK